jgi:protein-S-isoprenylcysteine O-methyltransferase Ste14
VKKAVLIYALRLTLERAIGLLLFLAGTGGSIEGRGILWFAVYFAVMAGSMIFLIRHGDLLKARSNPSRDTPLWDKLILTLFWLLAYFAVYYVSGKAGGDGAVTWLTAAGIVLYLLSSLLTDRALTVNPFAESTARIQQERGQTAVDKGPYGVIRHPMYAAILLWCVGIVLVFPVWPTAIVSAVTAVLIVVRTALEDGMLRRDLEGYEAYAKRTRWRLIPFVW